MAVVRRPHHPLNEFFRRSNGVYSFVLEATHDLVRSNTVVDVGCFRVINLCAYSPDGVVCGYDFEIVGQHVKCDTNFLGCWIDEFDRQKAARLTVNFELVHRLGWNSKSPTTRGVLLFEHPYGCSMALASHPDTTLMNLFNMS